MFLQAPLMYCMQHIFIAADSDEMTYLNSCEDDPSFHSIESGHVFKEVFWWASGDRRSFFYLSVKPVVLKCFHIKGPRMDIQQKKRFVFMLGKSVEAPQSPDLNSVCPSWNGKIWIDSLLIWSMWQRLKKITLKKGTTRECVAFFTQKTKR